MYDQILDINERTVKTVERMKRDEAGRSVHCEAVAGEASKRCNYRGLEDTVLQN